MEENKRTMITDLEKINELYYQGKISRTTWWRARKRGYLYINFHRPQDLGGVKFDEDEYMFLYSACFKNAYHFFHLHKEMDLDSSTEKSIVHDLAVDVFLKVIERHPVDLKQAFRLAKYKMREVAARSGAWYCKYMFVPDSKQYRKAQKMKKTKTYMEYV